MMAVSRSPVFLAIASLIWGGMACRQAAAEPASPPGRGALAASGVEEKRLLALQDAKESPKDPASASEKLFRSYDLDRDEILSLDEYVKGAGVADAALPVARRNVKLVDFDKSGGLSLQEFLVFPGILPTRERGPIPDPVVALFRRAAEQWTSLHKSADADANGRLSAEEWKSIKTPAELSPFQEVPFGTWDRDGDGAVAAEEAERLLAIAYGVRHPDGTLLRLPSGVQYYGSFLRPLDKDGDLVLSLDELATGYWGGREKGLELFKSLDADADQKLTTAEIMQTQPLTVDPLGAVIAFDKDLDARLSPAELMTNASTSATPLGMSQTMAAFDDDQDGHLSLEEYQLAPQGYGYVTLRVHGRTDIDHDAALSWSEFYSEKSPLLLGLAWEMFRRYDRNRDGQLDLDEFEFHITPSEIPLEKLFGVKDKDRNGLLVLGELFLETLPAEGDAAAKLRFDERKRYWGNWIGFADQDGNQALSPAEYQQGMARFPEAVYARFAAWDKSGDGELAPQEFLAAAASPDEPLVRRNFRVLDFDASGELSFDEFRSYPGQLPASLRGRVPDAAVDLVQKTLKQWAELQKTGDTNQDGNLSSDERSRLVYPAELSPFQDLPAGEWDTDGDGQTSAAEAERLFAVAYGLQQKEGTRLRHSTGVVCYGSFIRSCDKDGDEVLSVEELASSYWGGKEKAAALFQELDADRNGRLTTAEIMQTGPLTVDLLEAFLRLDSDRDGRLSSTELMTNASTSATPLGMSQTMAAFDDDRDGYLSFPEFQLAPQGYGYVTLRVHGRTDVDHDGALSWAEFYSEKSPVLLGLSWEMFRRYDRNHDGKLDLNEFEFHFNPSKLPLEKLFLARDANKNQKWEQEEYLAAVGSTPMAHRNFRLADQDGDQALVLQELRIVPGLVPLEQRGDVPDPVAELAAKALETWSSLAKAAGEASLSSRNWPSDELEKQLGPLGAVEFWVWDANRDGQVDPAEARRLIAIAYGLERSDGTPLRRPNGLVLFSSYLEGTDKNQDGLLSAEEFVPHYWQERSQAQELFSRLDGDKDGRLTYADFWKTPAISVDTYGAFLYLDKDFNGLVSRQELLEGKSSGATEARIEQMFPAFDENGDGQLSLREYRLLPIGMNYITYQVWGRQDADNNGWLSWKEFFSSNEPPLIGLAWEIFRHLDHDKDNQLGIDELEFQFDPAKVPVEIEFRIADRSRNQRVEFSEVFRDPKPESSKGPDFERYQMRLARAEDKFLRDDKDHSGWLTLDEFTESRQAAVAAAERHRRATGRLSKSETRDWFLPAFLVVDALVLIGVGWLVLRRRAA